MIKRCTWAVNGSPEEVEYHDREWGVPSYDDRHLFEMIILEGAQAGLSWSCVLKKRPGYHRVFDNFDAGKIASYSDNKLEQIRQDSRIIRNRLKIAAARSNAQAFLKIQQEFPSFAEYIWQFVGGEPVQNHWRSSEQIPASTPQSEAMSRDLIQRGFKFVGPTICYAYMQATGMVNDHTTDCFRHNQV
ncbi:MAG: DNA-3-methyladenine glycosylase I [Gammaproteobacteria bacterium]|nr:DNA-3-methyladenine glycosylase I [Gammaproteobacteria bacterium]